MAGAASPITVAGLARGKTYACSVAAANAQGTRLPSAVVNVTTSPNYQGLWWNSPAGSESGWGINFAHQGDTIFATWFTYDANGKPWWRAMVAPGVGSKVYSGSLFTVTGPAFNAVPFDAAQAVETTVGNATLAFADGNQATFSYTVNGVTQAKPIARQVFVSPGTVCR